MSAGGRLKLPMPLAVSVVVVPTGTMVAPSGPAKVNVTVAPPQVPQQTNVPAPPGHRFKIPVCESDFSRLIVVAVSGFCCWTMTDGATPPSARAETVGTLAVTVPLTSDNVIPARVAVAAAGLRFVSLIDGYLSITKIACELGVRAGQFLPDLLTHGHWIGGSIDREMIRLLDVVGNPCAPIRLGHPARRPFVVLGDDACRVLGILRSPQHRRAVLGMILQLPVDEVELLIQVRPVNVMTEQ